MHMAKCLKLAVPAMSSHMDNAENITITEKRVTTDKVQNSMGKKKDVDPFSMAVEVFGVFSPLKDVLECN